MSLNELAERIHRANVDKGFYDKAPWNNAKDDYAFLTRQLCLVHSEVSEAVEELRKKVSAGEVDRVVYWEGEKPEGFPIELADVLIRTLDLMAYCDLDVDELIELKLKYNASREHMHGGKTF